MLEALAARVAVNSKDPQLDQRPTADWGLDSLDFVLVLAEIESSHGTRLEFPSVDLHSLSLRELSDRLARTTCPCTVSG
ncbi:phosphopantetheine-binding protein [Streptomyces sp. NPDC006285]|uniref:phosphopantetheine-binding protein n=1 Tax=Streptomyces sp. NPDC006285 TaxID=3364742 RepID=UPI00367A9108